MTLQSSEHEQTWESMASGTVARTATTHDAFVNFDEAQAKHWRLRIRNGSNHALSGIRVTAYGAARLVAFDAHGQSGLSGQKRTGIKPQDATWSNRMTQKVGRLRQTKHDAVRVGRDAIGDRVEPDPPARSAEPR